MTDEPATDEFWDRFRTAARACDRTVFWHEPARPAQVLATLAKEAEDLDLWFDQYAERGPVELLEQRLAGIFGTEGAAFFPSGTMAQQVALRVWCDRAGSRRVALPDLSHLLVHELDGPRLLHGLEVEHLTTGRTLPTAAALAAVPGRLGAVLVELPLRDAGCALPTWEELTALSAAARERGVALHVDGARIWEAQPFWDRPFPEVAALADSLYVSFYKGLGGLAGAALVGSDDFLAEARRWRKRMGGTLFRLTAEALAGLVGLREHLPHQAECLAWARALAVELAAVGVTPCPDPPHTPTFEVFATGSADAVNERLLAFMERERLQLTGPWSACDDPVRIRTELMVATPALAHDPATVAGWVAEVVGEPGGLTVHVWTIDEALAPMQALASRLWSPGSRHHPGQLAWSARYAEPEVLDHGPVAVVHGGDGLAAWAWLEAPDWLELCVDPARPGLVGELLAWAREERGGAALSTGVLETEAHLRDGLAAAGWTEVEAPWFDHHLLDLADLAAPVLPPGYAVRAVRPGEAETRAAVHRAAWSATSRVTTRAYERLMATAPYRPDLDQVVEHADDGPVASCLAWLDERTGVALLEPVGCVPRHRGRGLAVAASAAALAAARDAGATTGLVCPRGDDGYPVPARMYRRMGFRPGPRTRTFGSG